MLSLYSIFQWGRQFDANTCWDVQKTRLAPEQQSKLRPS